MKYLEFVGVQKGFLLPIHPRVCTQFFFFLQNVASWRLYLGSFQKAPALALEKNQTFLAKICTQGVSRMVQLKSHSHSLKASLNSAYFQSSPEQGDTGWLSLCLFQFRLYAGNRVALIECKSHSPSIPHKFQTKILCKGGNRVCVWGGRQHKVKL